MEKKIRETFAVIIDLWNREEWDWRSVEVF